MDIHPDEQTSTIHRRRASDHPSCVDHHNMLMHKIDRAGRVLFEYIIITAVIAMILTTFQTWQTLKSIDANSAQNNVLFGDQNKIVDEIRRDIKDEIARKK